MIVDSHTHVFPPEIIARRQEYLARDAWFGRLYASPKARMVTAEELVAAMDAAGVDVAVTFGFGWADAGLCRLTNDYVAEAARARRDRLVGFAVVNPASREVEAEIARSAGLGLAGIGELMPDGQGFAPGDVDALAPALRREPSAGPWCCTSASRSDTTIPAKGAHAWPASCGLPATSLGRT